MARRWTAQATLKRELQQNNLQILLKQKFNCYSEMNVLTTWGIDWTLHPG
jgi:hypothetical protein